MTAPNPATDTTPEAEAILVQSIRKQLPAIRSGQTIAASYRVAQQCKNAIRRSNPDLLDEEVNLRFIELNYGKELADNVRRFSQCPMNDSQFLISALQPVSRILQSLNVSFFVGGSVASSYHGASRSTMDVDLVAELKETHIDSFVSQLNDKFYVSPSAISDAIKRKSCFNIIHLPSSFKVDIFISKNRDFDNSSMLRARFGQLEVNEDLQVPIASAEDTILAKLEWYRLGNEQSDRQWDDVSRIIKILGTRADVPYLKDNARQLGVSDLLEKLLKPQTD